MGDHLKVIRRNILIDSEMYRIDDSDIIIETIGDPDSFKLKWLSDENFLKEISHLKTFFVNSFTSTEEHVSLWQVAEAVQGGFNYGYDNILLRNEILEHLINNFDLRMKHLVFIVSINDQNKPIAYRKIVLEEYSSE
ncbi:MAG: hypothetical protein PHG24_02120 [Candidatus Pacebacteria bacterium]|nr:hypothetical protein [Candidatus Paceibacterota bacterium]